MTTQHTPGPWTVGSSFGHVFGPDDREVCRVTTNRRTGPELDANARLIAEAPAMFEALKIVLEESEGTNIEYRWSGLNLVFESAHAIIARIEGGQDNALTPKVCPVVGCPCTVFIIDAYLAAHLRPSGPICNCGHIHDA